MRVSFRGKLLPTLPAAWRSAPAFPWWWFCHTWRDSGSPGARNPCHFHWSYSCPKLWICKDHLYTKTSKSFLFKILWLTPVVWLCCVSDAMRYICVASCHLMLRWLLPEQTGRPLADFGCDGDNNDYKLLLFELNIRWVLSSSGPGQVQKVQGPRTKTWTWAMH